MTIAEDVARIFDDNGQIFESAHGATSLTIDKACENRSIREIRKYGCIRYEFTDGSAIILTAGGWDIGFPAPATCYCWAGELGPVRFREHSECPTECENQ